MKCSLLGICAILLSCLVVGSWGGNCDYKFPSGNYYNLQPLASRFTQSNPATATYADSRYLWAPCDIIPPATCNSLANAGMCQVISTRGYNLGMGPTPTWTEGNKIWSDLVANFEFNDWLVPSQCPLILQQSRSSGRAAKVGANRSWRSSVSQDRTVGWHLTHPTGALSTLWWPIISSGYQESLGRVLKAPPHRHLQTRKDSAVAGFLLLCKYSSFDYLVMARWYIPTPSFSKQVLLHCVRVSCRGNTLPKIQSRSRRVWVDTPFLVLAFSSGFGEGKVVFCDTNSILNVSLGRHTVHY